ncbi:hypothetical protein Vau01_003640 [Virgisporangium aurantiacum]|uniref:Uncharacterized protein n=1 Tax=Virgisporangium aurantiacum TaxID=175570 RepID=A0A8J3YY80_9ACTN|nr:hypothetical protein Vau01_003640 [Virgisporangium aurantiacum]
MRVGVIAYLLLVTDVVVVLATTSSTTTGDVASFPPYPRDADHIPRGLNAIMTPRSVKVVPEDLRARRVTQF